MRRTLTFTLNNWTDKQSEEFKKGLIKYIKTRYKGMDFAVTNNIEFKMNRKNEGK